MPSGKTRAGAASSPTPSQEYADDLDLVRAASARDETALESFLQRMRVIPRALEVQNRRAGSPLTPQDVEDLAQETFSTVWQRLDDYRGSARLETWVTRFCLFGFQNALRRRTTRAHALGEQSVVDERRPHAPPIEGLARALSELDERTARAIEMRELDGLPFEVIAATFREPLGTVKNRYYRGLQRLRDLLSRRGGAR